MRNLLLVIFLVLGGLLTSACGSEPAPAPTEALPETAATGEPFDSPLNMPNPASKFCRDHGYQLEMRTDASGTTGYCVFPDGSECEEWAFYRGECAPSTPAP